MLNVWLPPAVTLTGPGGEMLPWEALVVIV